MIRLTAAILAVVVGVAGYNSVAANGPEPPSKPLALSQQTHRGVIAAGGWSQSRSLLIEMRVQGTGGWLRPQVEIAQAGASFANEPNYDGRSKRVASGIRETLFVKVDGLSDGDYAWQARVVNSHGQTSDWMPYTTSGAAVRVDATAPARPRVVSSTNPKPGYWYRTKVERFDWTSRDAGSGIAGYSYRVTPKLKSKRSGFGSETSAQFKDLHDGKWVLHVWARDVAGNWSRPADYRFNLMRTAPKVHFRWLALKHFNPYVGKETWTFTVNHWAHVWVEVDGSKLKRPVLVRKLGRLSPGKHTFVWGGRDSRGRVVKHGWYWIRVHTSDTLGNHAGYSFGGVQVWPFKPRLPYYPRRGHHIVISLKKQAIYAYNGAKLVYWSLATTGNPALPTPTGHFDIFAKFHPFEFVSPWPPGSPYYYPPSWTSYAMEFISGGYFIHDAPWRTVFGPGSNGPGTPGTNYGGTHGCVNVPFNTAKFLFGWAGLGTPVDVLP